MLHIFNIPKLGHTVGKNVCSRLTLGKMCSNIERCVFRRIPRGYAFLLEIAYEKIVNYYNMYNYVTFLSGL